MTTNRTSIIAIGVVALLMICTLAGVVIINNNNSSNTNSDTSSLTSFIVVTDSSRLTTKDNTVTVNGIGTMTDVNSDTVVYSTFSMTSRASGTTISTDNEKISLNSDTLTVKENLSSRSNNNLVIFMTTKNNVTVDNNKNCLRINADIADSYLKNIRNDTNCVMTIFGCATLVNDSNSSSRASSDCYSMMTLRSFGAADSDRLSFATMTISIPDMDTKNTQSSNSRMISVMTNLQDANDYDCRWSVFTDVSNKSFSSRSSDLANNISVRFSNLANQAMFGDDTMITIRSSDRSSAADSRNDIMVNATNNLSNKNDSRWSVSLDLNTLDRYGCATISLGTNNTTDVNSLMIKVPMMNDNSRMDSNNLMLILPGESYSSDGSNSVTIVFTSALLAKAMVADVQAPAEVADNIEAELVDMTFSTYDVAFADAC